MASSGNCRPSPGRFSRGRRTSTFGSKTVRSSASAAPPPPRATLADTSCSRTPTSAKYSQISVSVFAVRDIAAECTARKRKPLAPPSLSVKVGISLRVSPAFWCSTYYPVNLRDPGCLGYVYGIHAKRVLAWARSRKTTEDQHISQRSTQNTLRKMLVQLQLGQDRMGEKVAHLPGSLCLLAVRRGQNIYAAQQRPARRAAAGDGGRVHVRRLALVRSRCHASPLTTAASVGPLRRVQCTFILAKQKQRVTVPAMTGWTLLETAKHHNLPLHGTPCDVPWDYVTFGEGPNSIEDHVVVTQEYFDKTGPIGWQERELLDKDEEYSQPTCVHQSRRRLSARGKRLLLRAGRLRPHDSLRAPWQVATRRVRPADQRARRHHGARARHQHRSLQLCVPALPPPPAARLHQVLGTPA